MAEENWPPKIVPPDAFLRTIPKVLNINQRLHFGAIVFACDVIEDALNRLHTIAKHHGTKLGEQPEWIHAQALSACWAMVDQVHVLRQAIAMSVPARYRKAHEFCDKYAFVKKMRDAMDHVNFQINNISKIKSSRAALFGSIRYCEWESHYRQSPAGDRFIKGRVVCINSGPVLSGPTSFPVIDNSKPMRIDPPISGYLFFAADQRFDLDELPLDLARMMRMLDADIKKNILEQLGSMTGSDLDDLLSSVSRQAQITLEVEFPIEIAPRDPEPRR